MATSSAATSVAAMAFAPWCSVTFSLRRFTLCAISVFTVLGEHNHASAGVVYFDSLTSRRAGARNYVDLHMHVPGQWSVQRAAQLRSEIEAALLMAVPGLYARIEMLPTGMETYSEVADVSPVADLDKNGL